MNIDSLRAALLREEVDPMYYRIQQEPDEGTWCLRRQGKTWLVFYFERGAKRELQRFKSESPACDYFFNRLTHG
jgi:hypothetical protein